MLKIWMNENNFNSENKVAAPDSWYEDYQSDDILDLDLAHEIIMNTSAITEIRGTNSFVTKFGSKISDDKLSEGCKMLLMMLNDECRNDNLGFYLNFMGENCDKYIEEISCRYDINIILTRPFIPTLEQTYKVGVYIEELGRVIYSKEEYISAYLHYF